jgi:hypothetical protein
VGLGFYELIRGLTIRTHTLGLKQWLQHKYFSTGSRKLVLQEDLCTTFDAKLRLRKFTYMLTPTGPFHLPCHSNGSRVQKSNRSGSRRVADCVR